MRLRRLPIRPLVVVPSPVSVAEWRLLVAEDKRKWIGRLPTGRP